MSFLLSDQREDLGYWKRYVAYLDSVRSRFPPNALRLADSNFWHDFEDHRCPHDAWLEEARVIEPAEGERREIRVNSLEIKLLGAYHDQRILLRYPVVYRFSLNALDCRSGMGDWRYDEFRLADNGHLIHEIEWANGSRWIIEADDIEGQWLPIQETIQTTDS